MTTNLKWRLSKLPTVDEIAVLVKDGIITKQEAHAVLFSQETQEDRDVKGLESEIKFLRELVERLSNNQRSKIVETIKYVEKPYFQYEWYKPYYYYAQSNGLTYTTSGTGNLSLTGQATSGVANAVYATGSTANSVTLNSTPQSFTDIKTF